MNALAKIQAELKAPKNQFNSFGKYNYRNCEDILEAVKPLLKKFDAVLTVSDSIEAIGGRIYVKATAKFKAADGTNEEAAAFAREAENKKGMDEAQLTGSTSSYARKYALGGLFCLDDTKDADSNSCTEQQREQPRKNAPQQSSNGNQSNPSKDANAEHYKAIKSQLESAMYPADVGSIIAARKDWIDSMPQAGRDALNNMAAAKREELGGAAA